MKVGFCGLGLMGAPMVRRLIIAGHDVHVWNRTTHKAEALEEIGAIKHESPSSLASECEVVILCLFDATAVEEVVFGNNGLVFGTALQYIIDHSSIPVDKTIEFATRVESRSVKWIDAPVSGGVAGAEQGTLAIMTGGDEHDLEQFVSLLGAYAQRVTHMGKTGAGQATKLCNQTIVSNTIAAISEAVALAESSGVDASRLKDALAGGWADSILLQTFVPRMTSQPVPASATLETMLKDLNTILDLASVTNLSLPVSSAACGVYKHAADAGFADQDVSSLINIYRK